MYGIVNQAIEDLVRETFGENVWEKVLATSGVEEKYFVSTEPYSDDVTYKLAGAAAEVTGLSVQEVLRSFGEWWILHTAKEHYGGLLKAGGSQLAQFLRHLPAFHDRVALMYPRLTPPEFQVSNETEKSIYVHYKSQREGLQDFVHGLMVGLGKFYDTPVQVTHLHDRQAGNGYDIFEVSW